MTSSEKIFSFLQEKLGKRIKILLIPYKRDMWDCLEGVYNIAKSTEGCIVKVCPIPYTFRTTQEQSGRWFIDDFSDVCSGDIVEYQKPPKKGEYDAILFHNPYDNANFVTSVHPLYYSDRLQGLSKLLCFVPYGIGSTMAKIMPGMVNADIVFTENEYITQEVKRQILAEGGTQEEADHICEKFILVGSTKLELNLNQQVPEEWKNRINGKRVVLITTSLIPFLSDPATEMLNVNMVISEYRRKADHVIIWREHPLMKPTILAMKPEYAQAYIKFQKNFIEQDLGIFDMTQDYRIAFSVADVLYSDSSSLVEIWQQTGKEIHIL